MTDEKPHKPELDPAEQKKAEEEESLNESITYEVVRKEGEKELKRPLSALTWAAIAGGLSMERVAARHPALLLPGHGEPRSPASFRVRLGATPPGSAGS